VDQVFLENPILLIGIFLVVAYGSSLYLMKKGIPNVVVYLLAGFLMANTFFRHDNLREDLGPWFIISETLALGLIGFEIGTELKFNVLSKEKKMVTVILAAEAGAAFVVVYILTFIFSGGNFLMSIILAGLATATAPAATIEILRKCRAKGPLTTRLQWILAFDDVVAICVVEAVLIYVTVELGGKLDFAHFMTELGHELGIAIALGIGIGLVLDTIIERMRDDLEMMELTLAVLTFSMGLAKYLETSVIMMTMIIGVITTNRGGNNYEKAGDLLEIIMSPVLALFFVLVGARVRFEDFDPLPWLALVYLAGRSLAKIGGAYGGARSIDLQEPLRTNMGLGLLSQGGVTLGLVSVAEEMLIDAGKADLGHEIVTILIVSTIFSVILGAFGTRFAVIRAGEHGMAKEPPEEHSRVTHLIEVKENGEEG
jgi:Kef-type K+ transport system membrane component KefB